MRTKAGKGMDKEHCPCILIKDCCCNCRQYSHTIHPFLLFLDSTADVTLPIHSKLFRIVCKDTKINLNNYVTVSYRIL